MQAAARRFGKQLSSALKQQPVVQCTCRAGGRRGYATAETAPGKQEGAEGTAEASSSAEQPPRTYPFSGNVTFPTATASSSTSPSDPYNLLNRVNKSLLLDSTKPFRNYFARRHPDRIPPGSIISVETYSGGPTPQTCTSSSAFAGVLMAVKRRHMGVDNAFTVRANVGRPALGTEVRYDVNSPWIKDVKILKRVDTARRAKLYFIRRDAKYLSGVQGAIRNSMIPTAQLTNDAKSINKTSPPSKSSNKKKLKAGGKK